MSSHPTRGSAVPPRSSRRFARNAHRREKQWLLFANLNADKLTRGKPQRRLLLATALQVEATALNLTHVLRMNLVGVTSEGTRKLDAISGAEMALKSHFCLCPSGARCPQSSPHSTSTARGRSMRSPSRATRLPTAPVPDLAVVGFTVRLYFSLIHGCIPIYVDLFSRTLAFKELAFPLPRSVRSPPATRPHAPHPEPHALHKLRPRPSA